MKKILFKAMITKFKKVGFKDPQTITFFVNYLEKTVKTTVQDIEGKPASKITPLDESEMIDILTAEAKGKISGEVKQIDAVNMECNCKDFSVKYLVFYLDKDGKKQKYEGGEKL